MIVVFTNEISVKVQFTLITISVYKLHSMIHPSFIHVIFYEPLLFGFKRVTNTIPLLKKENFFKRLKYVTPI